MNSKKIYRKEKRVHTYFILKFDYNEELVRYIKYIPSSKYNEKHNIWAVIYSDLTAEYIMRLINHYDFICTRDLYVDVKRMIEKADKMEDLSIAEDGYIKMPEFPLSLYDFQKAGVDYMLKSKRCFNADDMGLGKTIQTLCALETRQLYPALIVVPKICIDLDTWKEEATKWLPSRKVEYINGDCSWSSDIYIINYAMTKELVIEDYFERAGKQIANFKKKQILKDTNFKAVVFDESHKIKNASSIRTKNAKTIAKDVDYRWLLTGTPTENRPKELISQLQVLGRLHEFGGWRYFTNRYCDAHSGYGGAIDIDGCSNSMELNGKLRSLCYIRREKEDVHDEFPDKFTKGIPVEITNKEEYQSAINNIEGWIIEEKKKQLQANGAQLSMFENMNVNLDDMFAFDEEAIELQVINALRKIVSRGKYKHSLEYIHKLINKGKKIAVSANRRETQQKLISEFPNAPTILSGMSGEQKKANYKKYQNDKDCQIIICSLKASNYAINLHAGNYNVTMELDWNPKVHEQFEDRQHRTGQNKNVHCIYMIAKDTIDEDQKELLDKKSMITNQINKGEKDESMFDVKKELIKRIKQKTGLLK